MYVCLFLRGVIEGAFSILRCKSARSNSSRSTESEILAARAIWFRRRCPWSWAVSSSY
jgi:hypothetical protein